MLYHSHSCQFKILVFTYKSLKNEAQSYISDLLNWYQPNRPLRSATTTSIIPKRYKSVRYGKRLMNTGAAMRWNSLPNELKWGTMVYSCIEAVQNRALLYFLGLGKYAPNLAINGDMGWHMPAHRQWLCVMKLSCRMINMDKSLLTKQIYIGCLKQMNNKCKTWFYRVNTF